MNVNEAISSSFRDPSGFLFEKEGEIYRQVNESYKEDYECLMRSGLYEELTEKRLLIPHTEVDVSAQRDSGPLFKVIKPEKINYISYSYEWSFSQLKSAALITLSVQKIALKYDLVLKDATAFNVQFHHGRPVFIDTLSFERYVEGKPWKAYRQFCQHFLAPLALMCHKDIRLGRLLRDYIDGVPLDLASQLLPRKTLLKYSLLMHIHVHSKLQIRYANGAVSGKAVSDQNRSISKKAFIALMDSLKKAVEKLSWKISDTEWGAYYSDTNYVDEAMRCKEKLVAEYLEILGPGVVIDLGANTGRFSRIAAQNGAEVISLDIDEAAVEKNYIVSSRENKANILPLIMDLTNPSPALGWAHDERMSLQQRVYADGIMALALIHHIAISKNVPLDRIARFFQMLGKYLIIEFVPKHDSQVKRLLQTREDIFPGYTKAGFEYAFLNYFDILKSADIAGSERTIYFMVAR